MSDWTPGPWGYCGQFLVQIRPDGSIPINSRIVCEFAGKMSDADGNVLMAAPDLLAALRRFVEPQYESRDDNDAELIAQARAAIAKAEGA